MRPVIYLIVGLSGLLLSCDSDDAPNTEIPSVVLNVFQVRFPEALEADWEQINNDYEVAFEISDVDHKVLIDPKGNLLQHKYEITAEELPEEVYKAIKSDFELSDIDDVEILKSDEHLYYQMSFDRIFRDEELVFNKSGRIVTKIPFWD